MSILVDTSAWIEALRKDGNPAIQAQVRHTLVAGEAVTCPLVMLELWNGARGESERSQIGRLSDDLPSLEIDNRVWTLSWELAKACRSRGITVPPPDLLIIAVAKHHGAELVHCDSHIDLYFDSGS